MNVGTITSKGIIDTSQFKVGINDMKKLGDKVSKDIGRSFQRMGRNMQRTGRSMSMALTAPIAGFGILALRTAGNFEESMNRVAAISQATGKELQDLEDIARSLGATTQFSASEAADAMGFLAMAGFEVNDIVSSLPAVLDLAAAAKLDMASAADIASNIMSGFGMTAQELEGSVDVLAKSMTSANTDLTQLGEAMKLVGPVASGFGVQFEETAAAVGLLSDAGLQGSMAGTGLRRVLTQLSSEADKLGISAFDASGNMLPLADMLEQLEEQGMTSAEIMGVFGQRGGPAMQVLMQQGADAVRGMTKELENSGGTAKRIADQQMQGLNGAMRELKSAFEELQLVITESGIMDMATNLIKSIRAGIQAFSNLGDTAIRNVVLIAGGLASIGPILIGLGMTVTALGTVIAALTSPITLIIGAVAGLAASFVFVADNWDAVKERISDISWWRNTVIEMVQFLQRNNPFSLMIKGFNALARFAGVAEIPNPYNAIAESLDSLKVETKEYEHQFGSFTEAMLNGFKRVSGIDLGAMFVMPKMDVNIDDNVDTEPIERVRKSFNDLFATNNELAIITNGMRAFNEQMGKSEEQSVRLAQAQQFLTEIAHTFTSSFGHGMANVVVQGEKLVDTLKNIGKLLASSVIQKGLQVLLSGGLSGTGFFGSGGGLIGQVFGGLFHSGGMISGSGEKMIRAKGGEFVLTPQQMNAIGQSRTSMDINYNAIGKAFERALDRKLNKLGSREIYAMSQKGRFS